MQLDPGVMDKHGRTRRAWIALLVVLAVLPFIRTLGFGYVMDEIPAIRSNPIVHGWESLLDVWRFGYGSPDQPFEGLYRPVTMFLFAIVWNATGGWPVWFHFLALVLHAVATILVWRLLARGLGPVAAWLAAAWFAVHPLHVEAVANVANNSEILVGIWGLALVLFLLRVREKTTGPTLADAAIAGALCLAAVLSKESGAMMPIVALLCVWGWSSTALRTPSEGQLQSWTKVIVAFVIAAVVVAAVRAAVLGGPVTGESIAVPGIAGVPAWQRVSAMLSLTPKVIGLLLWTPELNPAYGPSEFAHARAWLAVAVLLLVALLFVFAIRLARAGDRRLLVALLWVCIAFLPASNLLVATGQILAERTLYVPSIGVAMCLGLVLHWSARAGTDTPRLRWVGKAIPAAVALLIAIGAVRAARWTEVWRSHESVHAQIIAADTANYRGFWYTAVYLGNNGRMEEAFPLVERAFRIYPHDPGLRLDYGDALLRRGAATQAVGTVRPLLALPDYNRRPRMIGVYLDALGRAYGADSVVAAANRLMTDTPSRTAAVFLGTAHEVRGNRPEALAAYRTGLRLAPGDTLLLSRIARLQAPR